MASTKRKELVSLIDLSEAFAVQREGELPVLVDLLKSRILRDFISRQKEVAEGLGNQIVPDSSMSDSEYIQIMREVRLLVRFWSDFLQFAEDADDMKIAYNQLKGISNE